MKRIIIAAAALALVPFVAIAQEGPTDEQMAKIDEVLKAKTCEVDPANVEVEDDGLRPRRRDVRERAVRHQARRELRGDGRAEGVTRASAHSAQAGQAVDMVEEQGARQPS